GVSPGDPTAPRRGRPLPVVRCACRWHRLSPTGTECAPVQANHPPDGVRAPPPSPPLPESPVKNGFGPPSLPRSPPARRRSPPAHAPPLSTPPRTPPPPH